MANTTTIPPTAFTPPPSSTMTSSLGYADQELWHVEIPPPTVLLMLVGISTMSVIMGYGIYRALLKWEVRQGTEPMILSWTITYAALIINQWIWFAALFSDRYIGVGIPGILAAITLLLLLMMIFLRRIKKLIILLVLIVSGLVIFQIGNL